MKPHKLEQRLPESSILTRYRQLIHAAVVALSLGAVGCHESKTPMDKPDAKPDSGETDGGMTEVDSGTDSGTDSGKPDANGDCTDLQLDPTEWKDMARVAYGEVGTVKVDDAADPFDGISATMKSVTLERETDVYLVMAPSAVTAPNEFGTPMDQNGIRLMALDAEHPYNADCTFNEVGFNKEMMEESSNKAVITARDRVISMVHAISDTQFEGAGTKFEVEHVNGDTIGRTPGFSDILFVNNAPVGKVEATADSEGYVTIDLSDIKDEGSHIPEMLELEIDDHTFTRTDDPDLWISDEVFPNGTHTLKGEVKGGNWISFGNEEDALPFELTANVNVEAPDTTPPGAPALDQSDMTVGPAVTMVTISGDIPNPTDTAVVQMRMDGGSWVDIADYTAGDNRFMVNVVPGSDYDFRTVDSSDNASSAVGLTVTVDSMAPMTPIVNLPDTTTVGPNNLTVNVTGTIPQPADTVALEYQLDGGTWTAVIGYTAGDSAYSFNVDGPAMVKLRVKDSFGNAAETSTYTIDLDNTAPVDVMVDQAVQVLPIAATEFTVNLTVSADTEKVYVYKDGVFYDEVLTGGQTMLAVPVTHAAGTTATYGFAPLDQFENEGNKTDVEVQMAPAPTISNLAIDCSGGPAPGYCASGGFGYPISFDSGNATKFTVTAERISGTGTAGTVPAGEINIVGSSNMFDYTTGSGGGSTIRITINATGLGGASISTIDVFLF